jgi:hypothetical protein
LPNIFKKSSPGLFQSADDKLVQGHVVYGNHFEAYTWNISHSTTLAASDPFYGHFIVFIDEIHCTVPWAESSYLTPIFDELDSYAFADS